MKKKVLVVDDDPSMRILASEILSGDFEVLTAVDGLEGLEKAFEWRPHLVISDLMMPRMHGYELCTRLKAPDGVEGVKVLICSSKSYVADMQQAVNAGADDYLVKPYEVHELQKKVGMLLADTVSVESPPVQDSPPAPSLREDPPAAVNTGNLPVYLRFWGTRGSCPTCGQANAGYGGNTPCSELRVGDTPIIFDCGTGMRELGNSLVREFGGRPIEGHILVGHTHWDHIQGFPFFVPMFLPSSRFSVYSVRGAHRGLKEIFSDSMSLDFFPIPISGMAGKLDFVELSGPVDIGIAKISFQHLNHPGVCIGFRVEAQGRVVTYLSDHERFSRLGGESDMTARQDAEIISFAKGSDLVVLEAQYTNEEYDSRKGWGHSTYDDAVRFAVESGAQRIAVFHHDPAHDDEFLDSNIDRCRGLIARAGLKTEFFGARDGMRIDL